MELVGSVTGGKIFTEIYKNDLDYNTHRYSLLIDKFNSLFESSPEFYFSSPGRLELSGNHTDHNHGKVIAGSINLDIIAAVTPTNDNIVTLYSEGYELPVTIELNELSPQKIEKGSTKGIIRGIAAGLRKNGFLTGGFDACISSDVLIGSGLSSSASIEVMLGTIFNKLYNNSEIPFEKIAIISQYAENEYFGKPCGLMDQVACAAGGIVSIDFENPSHPVIEKLEVDFGTAGYNLVIVDTGGNHADLTDEYSSIPEEMNDVAKLFGKMYLRECNEEEFYNNIRRNRSLTGDRALLRALHFWEENKRVTKQVEALKNNDIDHFLKYVNESGNSSFKYLQNIFTSKDVRMQGVSLALALSEIFIHRIGRGACRVNGGGFAGTIEAFIPLENIEDYKLFMSNAFAVESIKVLSIRNTGSVCLSDY
jgi:galactokinase